jgi:pimeloyl-ACP methyl ester carboxylesterase
MPKKTPQIRTLPISYRGKIFDIEYFYSKGHKETIVLLHGLGGAKENYWEACKSSALDGHTLICPDNPGTGNSSYYNDFPLDVDDLTHITSLFIKQLGISNFILIGTSMGGLTALLYLRGNRLDSVKAFINIEGNLMPEDCLFSSKVVNYDFDIFANQIFLKTILEMKKNGNTGYHIIAIIYS